MSKYEVKLKYNREE